MIINNHIGIKTHKIEGIHALPLREAIASLISSPDSIYLKYVLSSFQRFAPWYVKNYTILIVRCLIFIILFLFLVLYKLNGCFANKTLSRLEILTSQPTPPCPVTDKWVQRETLKSLCMARDGQVGDINGESIVRRPEHLCSCHIEGNTNQQMPWKKYFLHALNGYLRHEYHFSIAFASAWLCQKSSWKSGAIHPSSIRPSSVCDIDYPWTCCTDFFHGRTFFFVLIFGIKF